MATGGHSAERVAATWEAIRVHAGESPQYPARFIVRIAERRLRTGREAHRRHCPRPKSSTVLLAGSDSVGAAVQLNDARTAAGQLAIRVHDAFPFWDAHRRPSASVVRHRGCRAASIGRRSSRGIAMPVGVPGLDDGRGRPIARVGMTGAGSPSAAPDQGETLWLVVAAAAAVGLGCLLVTAGAISSAVFGGGLALPHSAEFGTIIRRTLADPGRPAAAWPPALSSRIPGPVHRGDFRHAGRVGRRRDGQSLDDVWRPSEPAGPVSPARFSCAGPRSGFPRPADAEPRPAHPSPLNGGYRQTNAATP